MKEYVFLKPERSGPQTAILDFIRNVDRDYELLRGTPRIHDFPPNATFDMHPDYGIQLNDVVKGGNSLVVISDKLKSFFTNQDILLNGIEFLPVAINDHKGRPIQDRYFILHATILQDCIDEEATYTRTRAVNPDVFAEVDDLTFDEDRMDPDVLVFRLKRYPYPMFFRRDLAERLEQAGFTGFSFGEVEDFDHFAML